MRCLKASNMSFVLLFFYKVCMQLLLDVFIFTVDDMQICILIQIFWQNCILTYYVFKDWNLKCL